MRYCGVVPMQGLLQLAMLEEVRVPEPPVQLNAVFFEPGSAAQIASELQALDGVVVGYGAPVTEPAEPDQARVSDQLLRERGVALQAPDPEMLRLAELMDGFERFAPGEEGTEGAIPEGAYTDFPAFETNADGVFCALQGHRLPARRHPLGVQLRIEELEGDHVVDDGGDLWHRRIEEIDAAAAALCAHRYAVGHAWWLGNPADAVVVLPGSPLPGRFESAGVMPPVERVQLPDAG